MTSQTNQTIYWTLFIHGQWRMYIAATSKGLCYIGSQNQAFEELSNWAKKRLPQYTLVQNEQKLQSYVDELIEYFKRQRAAFSVPVHIIGTPFQLTVWNTLCDIPYGQTYSYSDIAELIQKPKSVRAVGGAIGANPVFIIIPCHRVIGKNGKLTGFRGGLEMKKQLLTLEKQ
ncbi:methylated-DNA--[protein]-cysteine S-methyltransferase [Bacillus sp. CGMCC 1.60114]|uniref:methylated-DNA--[protein]-cysteine S-methyltransferase n=1 Tax=unclassified Bacillus (in: firmicutes) TaxID=185979 RepID=UPI00363BC5CA